MIKSIPIVDLSKLSTKCDRIPSTDDWNDTAKEIETALSSIGFAYLTNHGLDTDKINKGFSEAKNFFELDDDVKKKYLKSPPKSYHGYSDPGQELLHPESAHELRESYDFCGHERFYPEEIPGFEAANLELENECKPLIRKLLKILAISLEIEDEDFFINRSNFMDDPRIPTYSCFRSIYYPSIGDNVAPGTVRLSEHTDYGILTLLFQDLIGGLEVKTVEGNWVQANPIPGSVLINTGDLLEFWSNGHFPATKHRVLIPELELKKKVPRQSIVYFYHPDYKTIVVPFANKKGGKHGTSSDAKYVPVSAGEHAQRKLDNTYRSY